MQWLTALIDGNLVTRIFYNLSASRAMNKAADLMEVKRREAELEQLLASRKAQLERAQVLNIPAIGKDAVLLSSERKKSRRSIPRREIWYATRP